MADQLEILTIAIIGIGTVFVNILVYIAMKNQNDISEEYHEKNYRRDGLMLAFKILASSDQRRERARVLALFEEYRLKTSKSMKRIQKINASRKRSDQTLIL